MTSLTIGVDASRNRSGGTRAHLIGLMTGSDPREYGIEKVHLWAYRSLAEAVPDRPWLTKHHIPQLEQPIATQLWWQYATLPKLLDEFGCDLLFNTDAGSICPTTRAATLSQNLLPFEPKEMARYGLSKGRTRLELLRHVHRNTLRRSRLAIFLTDYARRTITAAAGPMPQSQIIPHGIDESFRALATNEKRSEGRPINCLYVSDAAPYKHHWNVVDAIADLRQQGLDVEITLVGGGSGASRKRLDDAIQRRDPSRHFVHQIEAVTNDEVKGFLTSADLFIFASSCESMPITLLEAMAAGLPICSSDRGPMPEILGQSAYYFNPESVTSIAESVELALSDNAERLRRAALSQELSAKFSWDLTANRTWSSLASVCG